MMGPHHLFVVWIKGLFNERELLSTQFPARVDKLSKLHKHKRKHWTSFRNNITKNDKSLTNK